MNEKKESSENNVNNDFDFEVENDVFEDDLANLNNPEEVNAVFETAPMSTISIRKEKKIIEEDKKKIKYLPVHICAFVIPLALMFIAFYTVNIFPFGKGDRQIMVVDSWHQYYPFLQELHSKLTSGGSLLYSWNSGAGTNFLALMSYYASTPLYFLSVLFPQQYLREFMMFTTMIKIACSGLFFSIYLRGIHNQYFANKNKSEDDKKDKKYCFLSGGFAIIGFSVLYAVSAYAVGYYWCIMWLDCMALLPLVILGLERLVDSGKFKLYIITLGITVICNYYIAIFVCEFIALYYVVLYFTKTKKPSVIGFIKKTGQAVGASVVGVGLSMFILLPTYLWFANTGNAGSTFARDITTYNSILDILTNLLPNTTPAIRAGLPNIACGLIIVILAGLYFINSKIRIIEKLFAGGFLLFMLFSFNMNILDYYWHGLHFPNEIPYRQAFVFTFVLITLAYKSYMTLDTEDLTKSTIWKFGLGLLGIIILAEQWYKTSDKFDFKVFYTSIAILVVYMAVLLIYKNRKISKSFLAILLMFIMIFEGGMSAVKGANTTGTSDRNSYPPSKENIQKTVKDIYEFDKEEFYRLEMSRWFSTNDPVLYGYRGISQFSSEANSRFARTLEILGIAATVPSNRFLYSSATPVFNSIMSIKYLMTREETAQYNIDSVVFDEMWQLRNVTVDDETSVESQAVSVYKNKYWLPLGFVILDDVKELKLTNDKNEIIESNIFITQNEFMKSATGIQEDVFKSIQQSENKNSNLNESLLSSYGAYTYNLPNSGAKGTVNHTYTSDKGQQVYMYIKSGRSKEAKVSVNGSSKNYEINRGITIDCGKVGAGTDINVTFDVDAGGGGTFYIFVAGFNEEVFKDGYDVLNYGAFDITEFKDTNIKGTVTAFEDGIFFTSIPYDKGWNVKIDGKKVEVNPKSAAEINDIVPVVDSETDEKEKPDVRQVKIITDGFITVPITAGEHTIELYYVTEGLVPGIIISILCVIVLVGLELLRRYIEKNKNRHSRKNRK